MTLPLAVSFKTCRQLTALFEIKALCSQIAGKSHQLSDILAEEVPRASLWITLGSKTTKEQRYCLFVNIVGDVCAGCVRGKEGKKAD